jgi:hypothetical protein
VAVFVDCQGDSVRLPWMKLVLIDSDHPDRSEPSPLSPGKSESRLEHDTPADRLRLGEEQVACRPLAGVVEASRPFVATVSELAPESPADALGPAKVGDRQLGKVEPPRTGPVPDPGGSKPVEGLLTVKLLLELLVLLVGLIGAILALFGLSRK